MESYILTRTMHLGFLKESFGKGAVIQYYPEKSILVVDGRKFEDYRDIEILKKQAVKKPHDPWIIPYSEEARAILLGEEMETAPVVQPRDDGDKMPVIQSDADSHEVIDIGHTKVSKISNAAKEAERNKVRSNDLPVIKGDESVEERLAELKDAKSTDLTARAERVRLMTSQKAEMPVVRDDSLGAGSGSKSAALNAGLPVGGKRAEEAPEASSMADARKAEVARNREKVAVELGFDLDAAGIDEATPSPTPQELSLVQEISIAEKVISSQEPVESELDPRDAEIARLKAQLEQLEADKVQAPPRAKKVPVIARED